MRDRSNKRTQIRQQVSGLRFELTNSLVWSQNATQRTLMFGVFLCQYICSFGLLVNTVIQINQTININIERTETIVQVKLKLPPRQLISPKGLCLSWISAEELSIPLAHTSQSLEFNLVHLWGLYSTCYIACNLYVGQEFYLSVVVVVTSNI